MTGWADGFASGPEETGPDEGEDDGDASSFRVPVHDVASATTVTTAMSGALITGETT